MDFAKDRRGKLIRAREASPHQYYICPVCAGDVFLRRGHKRVAHFAHRSGHGKKDCELFHPSEDISYTWTRYGEAPDNDWSGRPIEPLRLSIELEPEAAVRGKCKRGWGLRITVPKADDEHGQVSIDCGTGPPRKIALSKLILAAQTYPADLDAQDFGAVWTSPEIRPNYKAAVEERCPGLDRQLINVFAASRQKYLSRVDRLHWGNSYYFVWRPDAIPIIHDRLPLDCLADQGSWCCAFTGLPADEDAELKSWLEKTTGAVVTPHRRTFGVFYPPPYGADLYGRILIPAVKGLVLGVHLIEGDQNLTRLGDASATIALEGGRRHLIHVSSAQSLKPLWFTLDDAGLPPLLPLRLRDLDVYPEVRLSFRFYSRAGTEDVPLHKTRCTEYLRGVRRGECEIASFEYPAGVRGALRWRLEAEIAWNALEFHDERRTGAVRASVQQVVSLNDVLRQREFEIQFDFGPLGQFSAPIEHAVHRLSETRPIPGKLRNRALWLLKTAQIYANEQRVPLARLANGELFALLAAAQVGSSLVAHKFSLNRELSEYARGARP